MATASLLSIDVCRRFFEYFLFSHFFFFFHSSGSFDMLPVCFEFLESAWCKNLANLTCLMWFNWICIWWQIDQCICISYCLNEHSNMHYTKKSRFHYQLQSVRSWPHKKIHSQTLYFKSSTATSSIVQFVDLDKVEFECSFVSKFCCIILKAYRDQCKCMFNSSWFSIEENTQTIMIYANSLTNLFAGVKFSYIE